MLTTIRYRICKSLRWLLLSHSVCCFLCNRIVRKDVHFKVGKYKQLDNILAQIEDKHYNDLVLKNIKLKSQTTGFRFGKMRKTDSETEGYIISSFLRNQFNPVRL